jgi:adenosylcobinamide kinase/adenosylcobinamide-phosphate guanylyltransferase
MLTFLIGGARCGKTSFAESRCSHERRVAYVAAACILDKEMAERVLRHRQDRPAHWITIEETLAVEAVFCQALEEKCDVVLLDCLIAWLSNLLPYHHRRRSASAIEEIAPSRTDAIARVAFSGCVIVVSNEVGAGIVPITKVARVFRDLQGRLNQRMAVAADQIFFLAAGFHCRSNPRALFSHSGEFDYVF